MTAKQIDKLITVFGGSGFLGRYVVRALVKRGYRVLVAVRRPDLAEFLRASGGVGQIQIVQANIRDHASVARAVDSVDAVVNLVGILAPSGAQTFDAVQGTAPRTIAAAAQAAGVSRLVHISAIGADPQSPSAYARSKAAGERGIFETVPNAIIFRPSIVFGPEDDFFNRFAAMARLSPVLPLIGGGRTRFQPVYVGDVAQAVAIACDMSSDNSPSRAKPGTIYEVGGPDIKTFRECLEMMLSIAHRKRRFVNVPFPIARIQARILEFLPKPPLTVDQVELLTQDNVVSRQAIAEGRTLAGLAIAPRALEVILPTYLDRYRPRGQYDAHTPHGG